MESDSDDASGGEFRVVRRHCPSLQKLRRDTNPLEGADDAVSVPTPTMAALSPDTPSSPMSGDAQSQPRPGTEQHGGADTVAAPMALQRRSQDPLLPRGRLFAMIADLSTVQEKIEEKISSSSQANAVVEEKEVRCTQERRSSGPDEAIGVVLEQAVYRIEEQRSSGPIEADEMLEETEEDASSDDNNCCASCDDPYKANAFWIRCDSCKKWYHGKCVKITSSQAEHIGKYECPDCRDERAMLSNLFKGY